MRTLWSRIGFCVSCTPPFSDSRLSRPVSHLSGSPPTVAITAQTCLLAEITAAICARKHDRLFNTGAAARLAQGETFAELLKTAPAPILAPDTLPSSVHDRFSPDQFAATLAFLSKLRGEECVCFVLLGDPRSITASVICCMSVPSAASPFCFTLRPICISRRGNLSPLIRPTSAHVEIRRASDHHGYP